MKTLHPGIYIKEILKTSKITPKEFVDKTGIPEDVLLGNMDITYDVAYKLSLYFDNSINFWLNLQKNYNKN